MFILFRFIQFLESVIWAFLSIQGDNVETNFYKRLPIVISCGVDPQSLITPGLCTGADSVFFPETVHGPSLRLPDPPLGPR